MISIEFNGVERQVVPGMSIHELLVEAGIKPQFCAVERNLEIVTKSQYDSVTLEEGDRIEVVTLVGGG